MTSAKTSKKATSAVTIKAPKLTSAWVSVCDTSKKSEIEIVKSIENLSATMVLESRLSVTEQKKFIKGLEDSGKTSSFLKSSQAPALPTWSKLRVLHADFRALPIAKQLSTATASYNLLGSGKGEQIKTLDALVTEIATMRKAKNDKSATPKTDKPAKAKKSVRDTLKDILAFANSLDAESIGEEDFDLLLEIAGVLEQKTLAGVDA
jgi:hypothetical protein